MDQAVNRAPDDLEARFIRAASTWHLPFFFKRRDQAASDFAYIAPRAEAAVAKREATARAGRRRPRLLRSGPERPQRQSRCQTSV